VRKHLETGLEERMARDQLQREVFWTESVAVGSAAFVARIQPLIYSRVELEVRETPEGTWVLEDERIPYGCF
jgi:hypothetical protein